MIVVGLVFDRRDVVDGAVKAFGVVPVDPLIGGPFNLFPGGERSRPGMVRSMYLAAVIDTYSRKFAGYALADHMRVSLVVDAIAHAHGVRGSLDGAVFHSDHGSVYTSQAFRSYCSSLGVRQSMGAVGTSADNALAESFNATLKREVLRDRKVFDNPISCRQEVFRWCMRYNTRRRHSWCNLVAPDVFEAETSATLTKAA